LDFEIWILLFLFETFPPIL